MRMGESRLASLTATGYLVRSGSHPLSTTVPPTRTGLRRACVRATAPPWLNPITNTRSAGMPRATSAATSPLMRSTAARMLGSSSGDDSSTPNTSNQDGRSAPELPVGRSAAVGSTHRTALRRRKESASARYDQLSPEPPVPWTMTTEAEAVRTRSGLMTAPVPPLPSPAPRRLMGSRRTADGAKEGGLLAGKETPRPSPALRRWQSAAAATFSAATATAAARSARANPTARCGLGESAAGRRTRPAAVAQGHAPVMVQAGSPTRADAAPSLRHQRGCKQPPPSASTRTVAAAGYRALTRLRARACSVPDDWLSS